MSNPPPGFEDFNYNEWKTSKKKVNNCYKTTCKVLIKTPVQFQFFDLDLPKEFLDKISFENVEITNVLDDIKKPSLLYNARVQNYNFDKNKLVYKDAIRELQTIFLEKNNEIEVEINGFDEFHRILFNFADKRIMSIYSKYYDCFSEYIPRKF